MDWRRWAGGRARRTFTDLLRLLNPDRGQPDDRTFEELWQALRAALVGELRRRGLWESPPSYVGVYAAPSWWAAEDGGGVSALEELLADCYSFIFIDRLRALRAQLAVKPNVDGLVFMNVRHFLDERQREHDPLGFRVFEALRTAVQAAVEAGELSILDGDPRIRNDTVIGFAPGGESVAPPAADLFALVRRWNDTLLPDLVTAHGRGRQPVLGDLRRHLQDLRRQGIEAIRFKDLVDPMKSDVRARWAAILEREAIGVEAAERGEGRAGVAGFLRPDRGLEARDSLRALVGCISDQVEQWTDGETVHRDLETLWGFLRTWAVGGGEEDYPPSQRKLATLLGIPRERLPELYGLLRRFAETCDEKAVRNTSAKGGQGRHECTRAMGAPAPRDGPGAETQR